MLITIIVTPFTTDLPKIAVPGNHQGWDPPTAPLLAASGFGETDYEGYVWLDGGYKFVAPNETGGFFWGNTDWADDGTFTGKLVENDETDCTADSWLLFCKSRYRKVNLFCNSCKLGYYWCCYSNRLG